MASNNVKHSAAGGMIWSTAQRFAEIFVQFVAGIVLARLLEPSDYGCIGMLAIFITISKVIIDGGFGSALIQKKRPTQEDYSTIFYWNLIISSALYLILFFAAPSIASFYHIDLLCPVLRVQGVVLIINACTTIQVNQMKKNFRFKKIAIVSICAYIIAFSCTIVMAYMGFGVWALVTQYLLIAFIPAAVYWLTNHWFPMWCFSKKSFKELFSFGFFIFLAGILNAVCNNLQGLLIGRIYNSSTMGYYSKARSTEGLASNTISDALKQVTLPLYSEFQDDINGLIGLIKRLTSSMAFITFPMMLLLIVIAKPLFILLYSEKWIGSVHFFQILCLAGISSCLQGVNSLSIAAIGKSKVLFSWTIVKRIISLVLMVGGLWIFGIEGLLWGMVIQNWIAYFINAYLVSKHIGYKMMDQIKDLCPTLVVSLFAFLPSILLGYVLHMEMYLGATIQFVVFVSIYISLSYLFKLDSFSFFKQLVGSYINNLKTKK